MKSLCLFIILSILPTMTFAKPIVYCSERANHGNYSAYIDTNRNSGRLEAHVDYYDEETGRSYPAVRSVLAERIDDPKSGDVSYINKRTEFLLVVYASHKPNGLLQFGRGAELTRVTLFCQ